MSNSSTASPSALSPVTSSNDDHYRVKFLCSFLGSILPRPQDGKLRYVGGETRIVSVPRDVSYQDLMRRMKKLYEGAAILKYQQPDEDLDALVSVVNDDDVTNMMEEYEKLGSGDGFTRLRIFLFSHPDQDGVSHYLDGDEKDTERRYVDALNNLNDGPDFQRILQPDSPRINHMEDMQIPEHVFNAMTIEGGLHTQRSGEVPISKYNLHNLTIPRIGSGQFQPTVNQRLGEPDGTWSPAYYSPRQLPSSPSSARYRMPLCEVQDKGFDRMPEEYVRQMHGPENAAWVPTGVVSSESRGGFPGNVLHGNTGCEGNGICESCRITFHRNQQQLEQPNVANGIHPLPGHCAECLLSREAFTLHADPKMHHVVYQKDHNDPRSIYNESFSHERTWMLQQQMNPLRVEEMRAHISSGGGRLNDNYVLDGVVNFPVGHHVNLGDVPQVSAGNGLHRTGSELPSDTFQEQALGCHPHVRVHAGEECAFRYGNYSCTQGADKILLASHGHIYPQQTLWKNVMNHVPGPSAYDASGLTPPQVNGSVNQGFLRIPVENATRPSAGMENQTAWLGSSQMVLGLDAPSSLERSYVLSPQAREVRHHFTPDSTQPQRENITLQNEPSQHLDSSGIVLNNLFPDSKRTEVMKSCLDQGLKNDRNQEQSHLPKDEIFGVTAAACMEKSESAPHEAVQSNCSSPVHVLKFSGPNTSTLINEDIEISVEQSSFLPELIASVRKATLERVAEVKAQAEEEDLASKDESSKKLEQIDAQCEAEVDSHGEKMDNYKIEPTKAEAEAIARGLQTIKNGDLEEIRELGSGTYGAVYHGKWKGSDVAIKRIKASCFAGRPSERERLIADFWKEAQILSSLHHPNVVSFYGIVRDGPDGSLATVTEFMVNGSLKQFLQKKDRTIDRRKRLIIAMDAAFGMEYLHMKNIVHFDLKCENLLVNMRDPQRPICKIGDLGLSKMKQQTLVSGGVRGTLPWMAPELLSGKSNMVSEKIDVYSFGIVMWELLTGDEPYSDLHCASIIGGIVNDKLRPKIPAWCDPEWKSLMENCWASDPTERPSFSEISQKLRVMAAAMNVK